MLDNKSIIVFSNTDATNLYEMSEQLYLISTGQKITIPQKIASLIYGTAKKQSIAIPFS
jgi:hypothetical protein